MKNPVEKQVLTVILGAWEKAQVHIIVPGKRPPNQGVPGEQDLYFKVPFSDVPFMNIV